MSLESLASKLKPYGKVVKLASANGSILVSEYGGRVIGLSVQESPNLLWVNPGLETVLEEKSFNVGGLRVWISPERNFFYRDPEHFEQWFCPRQLDPGSFKVLERLERSVTLESRCRLEDLLNAETLSVLLRREIAIEDLEDGLAVHIRESLTASDFHRSRVCLWALGQVYPGYGEVGTVAVPVKPDAKPIRYFGPIPEKRLKTTGSHVAFLIDGEYVCKVGIKPEDLRLRGWASIGYFTRAPWNSDEAFLLIMETCCAPRSQGECLDVAKADPKGPKAAVQSYNSGPDGERLRFGEIELQFPQSTLADGLQFSTVSYMVKAYRDRFEHSLKRFRRVLESPDIQPF